MEIDWSDVARRVQRLQDAGLDAIQKVHGATGHRFQFAPPLSKADLVEAETQFGVRLPDDYRAYLLHAGSGGAGPDYGLFRLTRGADRRWNWFEWGDDATDIASLSIDFDPDCVKEELDRYDSEEPPREDVAAWEAWNDRWETLEKAQTRGAICLAHQGCGYLDWLVVSGPHRGSVWGDARSVGVELAPIHAGHDFGYWYLAWLQRAEREVFGTGSSEP